MSNQVAIKPRVNAAGLGDDITHALHRSGFFDANAVHVHADGGQVRLTGTVHSLYERQLAGETAWSAPGTATVDNDLAIA